MVVYIISLEPYTEARTAFALIDYNTLFYCVYTSFLS